MTEVHGIKTKHKTKCNQYQGKLPANDTVSSNKDRVTCNKCKQSHTGKC